MFQKRTLIQKFTLGATITKFFGAVKVHDALEEGRGEEVDKTEEYVPKGLTEG